MVKIAATEFLSGKREIYAAGKEGTYGSPVSPTIRLGRNPTWTPNNENSFLDVRGAATDSLTQTYAKSNKIARGTLKFVPQDFMMLVFAIGTTTNTSSAPTTHTFSNNTDFSIHPFTLERAIQATTNRVRTYEGCQCNRLTYEWAAGAGAGGTGAFITCTMDILAQDVINGTSTTSLTAPTYAGFQARNVLLTLNSTAKARLIRGRVVIDNHLSDGRYAYYTSDDRFKGESQAQYRTYEGEFVLHYTDDTEFDQWDSGDIVGDSATTGTATAGGNNTLTDSGSGWTINQYANFTVKITGGAGAGQTRAIVSNTSEVLTVYDAWGLNPDATSTFTIYNKNTIVFQRGTNDLLTGVFTNLRVVSSSDPTNLDGFNMVTMRWIADDVNWVVTDINDQTYIT